MSGFEIGQEIYVASQSTSPSGYQISSAEKRKIVELAGQDSDGLQQIVLDDGMRVPAVCVVDALSHDLRVVKVRMIREALEISLADANKAFELYRTGVCPDALHAAFYVYANGLLINVKGGPEARHEWQMKYAESRAQSALERDPSLAVIKDIDGAPFAVGM